MTAVHLSRRPGDPVWLRFSVVADNSERLSPGRFGVVRRRDVDARGDAMLLIRTSCGRLVRVAESTLLWFGD